MENTGSSSIVVHLEVHLASRDVLVLGHSCGSKFLKRFFLVTTGILFPSSFALLLSGAACIGSSMRRTPKFFYTGRTKVLALSFQVVCRLKNLLSGITHYG